MLKCLGVFGYLGEGAEVSGRFGGILARVLKCVVFVLNLGGRAWVSWRGCSSVWASFELWRGCSSVWVCLVILARAFKCLGSDGHWTKNQRKIDQRSTKNQSTVRLKIHPKSIKNQSKINQKPISTWESLLASIFMDFGGFPRPSWSQVGTKNPIRIAYK